jgi:RNA polymerase sigma-70 factor (sigma-E family)
VGNRGGFPSDDAGVTPAECLYEAALADSSDGFPTSFEAFVVDYAAWLGRLAYLLTGDRWAADDLVADTLTVVWRSWPRIADMESPVAYVRRVLLNLASSRVRTLIRDTRCGRLMYAVDRHFAEHDPDLTGALDLHRALAKLPPRRRACVILRYAFDLSEAEVAETLGLARGTVKAYTARGAAQLRDLLAHGDIP